MIGTSPASAMFGSVDLDVPGNTENTAVGNGGKLKIIIPGVETPLTLGQGSTTYTWDVTNAQSQFVDPGIYYIKVQESDAYGHINVVIKEITVVQSDQYVQMTVFNTAGEIVKVVTDYTAAIPANIDLGPLGDLLVVLKDGTPIHVKYDDAGDYLTWDGRNDQGQVVSSGDYEIQVTVRTYEGTTISAVKTMILLRQDKQFLDKFEVWPNPFTATSGTDSVLFNWTTTDAGETGDVMIRMYDVAGELVEELRSTIQAGSMSWALRTPGHGLISRGFYVCVLYARNNQGYSQVKTTEFAITSYK